MHSNRIFIYVLCALILSSFICIFSGPDLLAQKDTEETTLNVVTNLGSTGNYTYDQINNIIYNLYYDFRNSNKTTEFNHYHDIAILIDLVCSDEQFENNVEACDIVTELPSSEPSD
jgi:hypothetical protein